MPRLLTRIIASLLVSCLIGDPALANALGECPQSRAETFCPSAFFEQEAIVPAICRYPSVINPQAGIREAGLEKQARAIADSRQPRMRRMVMWGLLVPEQNRAILLSKKNIEKWLAAVAALNGQAARKPNLAMQVGGVTGEQVNRGIRQKMTASEGADGAARSVWNPSKRIPMARDISPAPPRAGETELISEAQKLLSARERRRLQGVQIIVVPGDFLYAEYNDGDSFTAHKYQPMHVGIRRRAIYISEGLWSQMQRDPALLAAALGHELVHLRRLDRWAIRFAEWLGWPRFSRWAESWSERGAVDRENMLDSGGHLRTAIAQFVRNESLDALFENQTMVKTILQAVTGDPARDITLTDILQWVQRLTFEEQINLPPSGALPNATQKIYIVTAGERRYAVLLNREQTPLGVSVSGAIAPTKEGQFPSVFYQMPRSMVHALQQRIESMGTFRPYREFQTGLKLWPGWIRSDYDRLVFQESLELHPVIKRFIQYWLQNGIRPVVRGVWELFNPDDPSRRLKDEAGACFVSGSNSIIRNTGGLNAGDVSPFVHEFIHAIFAQLNPIKQQQIEKYFRQNHPEFINLFKDISVYQGAESTLYATEALAFYLQMALTGFWGLDLSKNAKLILTNEDLDFFEQLGVIDATIKAMILKQVRNEWMNSFSHFWTMPEKSHAVVFSEAAIAKRMAASQALFGKDPFDLSSYSQKPSATRAKSHHHAERRLIRAAA